MASDQDLRIWRYMDISKFLALLTTRSLYFACPSDLGDPYEGFLPKSQVRAYSEVTQRLVDDIVSLRSHFAVKSADSLAKFDELMGNLQEKMQGVPAKAASKFGVSYWHINE